MKCIVTTVNPHVAYLFEAVQELVLVQVDGKGAGKVTDCGTGILHASGGSLPRHAGQNTRRCTSQYWHNIL